MATCCIADVDLISSQVTKGHIWEYSNGLSETSAIPNTTKVFYFSLEAARNNFTVSGKCMLKI